MEVNEKELEEGKIDAGDTQGSNVNLKVSRLHVYQLPLTLFSLPNTGALRSPGYFLGSLISLKGRCFLACPTMWTLQRTPHFLPQGTHSSPVSLVNADFPCFYILAAIPLGPWQEPNPEV